MHKFAITIILFLCSLTLFAQDEEPYFILIESRLRGLQRHGKIFCADKPPRGQVSYELKTLSRKKINQYIKAKYVNLTLTRAEVNAIQSQMQSAILYSWRDSLFTDSKRIFVDSIGRIVSAFNRSIRDSIINIPVEKRPDARILKWEFYFSKPVYLRGGTLLFYFFMYYRESSGSHGFYLSQLKDGIWEEGVRIGGGDW